MFSNDTDLRVFRLLSDEQAMIMSLAGSFSGTSFPSVFKVLGEKHQENALQTVESL